LITILSVLLFLSFHSPQDDFKQQLEDYLHKNLSSYASFEYEIISKQLDLKKFKAEIIEDEPLVIKGDLANIQIKLIQNNHELRSVLNLRLKLYKELLVSVGEIKKEEPLSINDFNSVKINIANLKGTPFNSLEELNEYEAKININPGTVLIKEIMEKAPVIRPGSKIEAVLERGNVFVSMEAYSKQEGAKGDIIKIEVPMNGSRKIFKAKIENSNKATIIE